MTNTRVESGKLCDRPVKINNIEGLGIVWALSRPSNNKAWMPGPSLDVVIANHSAIVQMEHCFSIPHAHS